VKVGRGLVLIRWRLDEAGGAAFVPSWRHPGLLLEGDLQLNSSAVRGPAGAECRAGGCGDFPALILGVEL